MSPIPAAPTSSRSAYIGRNGITMPKPSRSTKTVTNNTVSGAPERPWLCGASARDSTFGIDLNRAMKQILCRRYSQAMVPHAQIRSCARPAMTCTFRAPGVLVMASSSYGSELKRKTVSAEQAAALVRSGSWIDYGFGVGQPDSFDQALAARISKIDGVKLRGCLAMRPRAAVEADPEGRHITYLSWYFSGTERKIPDCGLCHHIPMNFGEPPDHYRRFVDVHVSELKT